LGSDISSLTKLIKRAVPGGTTIIDIRANRVAELCAERASRGVGLISETSPAEQKAPEGHDTVTLVIPKIANAWFSFHSVKCQPRDNKMFAKTTHVRRALRMLRMTVSLAVGAIASSGALSVAEAQIAPSPPVTSVVEQIIKGWQTSNTAKELISAEMQAVADKQTGGSGTYQGLVALGAVASTRVMSEQVLPKDTLFAAQVTHAKGASAWLIGIDQPTRLASHIAFVEMSAQPKVIGGAHLLCLLTKNMC
jgi:hypothetical protein